MVTAIIAAAVAVVSALVGAGIVVARAVRAWTREVMELRMEIARLRQDMTEQRADDRIEVRDLIEQKIEMHEQLCPALAGRSKR
jgi:hypothetical protein